MQLQCPSCHVDLHYSDKRPSFCAYCGQALSEAKRESTAEFEFSSEAATLPPSPPSAANLDLLPQTVAGYRLLRPLGSGGMGTVHEAEEIASGRRVAIKLISPEYATSPETVARFRQEGRLASMIVHPRCVFVLKADEEAGRPYIVMELMPGSTLQDLVKDKGPLPLAEAVAKILDVIDGLQEAHRLNVVHRDVKPSNCFLEADGRVKIGDFGLSKSLVSDAQLTRVGAFMGTPLYASPEQVRADPVDRQSDVYAVAATLYFLLTGRAPHQTGDPTATMARIVADDAPSLLAFRPEIPEALDQVVLRGLERDRQRRWSSLEELRSALLPFLPGQLSVAGLGLRLAAYSIDCLIFLPLTLLGRLLPKESTLDRVLASLMDAPLWIVYFALLEGLWGWSLGKRCLRLRVVTSKGNVRPGVRKALLRVSILYALVSLPPLVINLILGPERLSRSLLIAMSAFLGVRLLGILAMASTLRARNGYRGLHEILSGSRVVRLPGRQQRQTVQTRPFSLDLVHPESVPERIGPFVVKGTIRWTAQDRTLVANDPALGRTVWLWLRPDTEPPLEASRRNINRTTRIRWVACGTHEGWHWDAFLASAGCPLPTLVTGDRRLSWAETRTILEDLAEELAASCAEGTLPQTLSVDQVWVDARCRVQLLGTPLSAVEARVAGYVAAGTQPVIVGDQPRSLALLRQVAALALEGRPRPQQEHPPPPRAPLPRYAAALLDGLFGASQPYTRVDQFQADLAAVRERPGLINRGRRALHLAVLTVTLVLVFALLTWAVAMWAQVGPVLGLATLLSPRQAMEGFIYGWPLLFVAWAFVTRGGVLFPLLGMALARSTGGPATRLQCAWRALLFWLPIYGWMMIYDWISTRLGADQRGVVRVIGFAVLAAIPVAYAVAALWNPSRSLHDRLAGTYVVPR